MADTHHAEYAGLVLEALEHLGLDANEMSSVLGITLMAIVEANFPNGIDIKGKSYTVEVINNLTRPSEKGDNMNLH